MQRQEILIATIADLLAALGNPQVQIRTVILQAIAGHPAKVTALAQAGEIDLFRELATLRDQPGEAGIRANYIQAMLSLDDERVFALAREEFLATDDSNIVLLTASRLAALPTAERIAFLGPVLFESADQNKRRTAANLLAHCLGLSSRLAIRVAVLSDHVVTTAPLDDTTLPDWLEELQGPYSRKARKLLLARPDGSFAALLGLWGQLPSPVKLWAFEEAVRMGAAACAILTREILLHEQENKLLLAALRNLRRIPPVAGDEALLRPYLRHADPMLRAAAIAAVREEQDWATLLEEEGADLVRVAIVDRLGQKGTSNALPLLAARIEKDNWRVRAAATCAMVNLAPGSIPVLHALFGHRNPVVRTAAAQALRQLGEDDLLVARLCKG